MIERSELVDRANALREEYTSLLDAHHVLLDCGIESHTSELRDRLTAIKVEVAGIVQRLYTIGADPEFHQVHQFWTTVVGFLNLLHLNRPTTPAVEVTT